LIRPKLVLPQKEMGEKVSPAFVLAVLLCFGGKMAGSQQQVLVEIAESMTPSGTCNDTKATLTVRLLKPGLPDFSWSKREKNQIKTNCTKRP
jgi:hypothetical protein